MRVLIFSADPSVLAKETEAYRRMRDYRRVLGELDIVVSAGRIARLWRVYREASRLLQSRKYDIITVQAPDELGLIGFYFSRRYGIPLQVQIHTDIMSPWYRRASWKERIRYWIARFLIPRADCIRVVSERVRNSITQRLNLPREVQPHRISVLPIFTDVSRFLDAAVDPQTEERFRDYTFKMIAVGRFVDKEKNFSMLIEVMRDFVKVCPEALLMLVGDGPDRKKYESRIKNQGFGKNIILESWRNDLPSFYKSFDLFLSSSNYEGWGRVVLEAMAAGLPVLMTDTGLAGEVVESGKNGVIVPVGDYASFFTALRELYNNQERRMLLAERGRESVQMLEPRTKEEYLRRYKETLICRKQ